MNNLIFQDLISQQHAECLAVLKVKGNDYSNADVDRLSNFKLVAQMIQNAGVDCDPKLVWTVYFLKHILSIVKGMNGSLESEPIESRFTDAINYLFLGRGLYAETPPPSPTVLVTAQELSDFLDSFQGLPNAA